MKILAFMQCMWVRDPKGVANTLSRRADDADFQKRLWRRMVSYSLFAGCLSGRRLKTAYPSLWDKIIWDESTKQIGGESSACFPPDLEHIRRTIADVEPRVIITFGQVASEAVARVLAQSDENMNIHQHFRSVHPAARGADTQESLIRTAREVWEFLEKQKESITL